MVQMISMVTGHPLSAHRSRAWLQMIQAEQGEVREESKERSFVAAMISILSVFTRYMMHRWSVL